MAIPKALEIVSPLMGIIGSLVNKKRAGSGGAGAASPSSYRRGGKVKKGGRARVHKGEVVLTAKQARKRGRGKRSSGKR